MKRIFKICLVLTLAVALMLTLLTFSQAEHNTPEEAKRIFEYDIFDDSQFGYDYVYAGIFKEYSEVNKPWTLDDFPGVEAYSVVDTWALSEKTAERYIASGTENFHQILKFKLINNTPEGCLEAIRTLESFDFVKSANPQVHVDFDETYPNDPLITKQNYLDMISAYSAWDETTGTLPNGDNIRVGIIDSGVYNHPDLVDNLVTGYDFVHENTITTDDEVGHGTMVTGIIGAVSNNATGICGICWNVDLFPLQVLNTMGGAELDLLPEVLSFAEENDISIVNISAGGTVDIPNCEDAINNYKGLVVCAAGNDRSYTDGFPHYPSSYTCDNIISVAAIGPNNHLASFSNYGEQSVDVAALGMGIYTTLNTGSYNDYYIDNDSLTDHIDGTSFSAPIVTGVAALIKSIRPDFSPARIKFCILETVDFNPFLTQKVHSSGTANASEAIDYALDEELYGDVNGDGVVDIVDVNIVRRVVAGLDEVTDITYYDVDGNNSVDSRDLLMMRQYIDGVQLAFLGW